MGTMMKMRENTGVILWILVISFGVIWVLQDSGAFDTVGVAGSDIAVVDGEGISVDEYNNLLNTSLQRYQDQTGESAPPQYVDLQRDQVFDALVEDRLRTRAMDELGIAVTDDELYNMILGSDPHPFIRQNFSDGQGGINRALLQSFVDDPANREQIISIEEYLRQQRRAEKLNSLLNATVRVSEQDVLDEHLRQNKRVTADYVALRYASIPDDSIEVADGDLRAFYNENREDFRQERTYTLSYVTVSKLPSAQDTAAVMADLERLRPQFAETDDDSLFLFRNGSERPYTSAFFTPDELDAEITQAVYDNAEAGRVVGPVLAGGQAHLVKILDTQEADDTFVRARHILFRAPEGDEAAREAALERARALRQEIQGGADFGDLARQFSDDGSAAAGGDLGWFGPGRMVEPFEEAAFDASVGQVTEPVETRFGVHLIEVTDRTDQAVQIADYALSLRPSVATVNAAEERLADLQYFAQESGEFTAEAERAGLDVQQVQVEAGTQFIPGLQNSRGLTTFMENADVGNVSEVIELNEQFVVAQLTDVQEEGYRSFEEVQSELAPRVRIQKKRELALARLRRAAGSDLPAIASSVGAPVRTAQNLTMANPVVSGLGREPAFVGAAFGLDEGETSGVIEGSSSAYVLRATGVQNAPELTEAMRAQIRQRLLNQRRQQVRQEWIAALREDADIVDNRRLFEQ